MFAADFSDGVLGETPAGWTRQGTNVSVTVAQDPKDATNQVLRVQASGEKRDVGFYAPRWSEDAAAATVVGIDFDILVVSGLANLYIIAPGSTTIHLRVDADKILWRSNNQIGALGDDWNRVRLIANRVTSTMDIYLNDMDTPVSVAAPFREAVGSWENAQIRFSNHVEPERPIDYYYDNLKVWVVE